MAWHGIREVILQDGGLLEKAKGLESGWAVFWSGYVCMYGRECGVCEGKLGGGRGGGGRGGGRIIKRRHVSG